MTLLAAATVPAGAAMFGADDRGPVGPSRQALAANVGILHDSARNPVCTAFCVGPRTIATAAHCLIAKGEAAITRPDAFTFVLDPARAAPSDNAAAASSTLASERQGSPSRTVLAGSRTLHLKPPIESAGDWALARLAEPICIAGGLRLSTLSTAELRASYAARHTVNLAFHKDLEPVGIAAGTDCGIGEPLAGADARRVAREFAHPEDLLLHSCDTAGGSSGSPLIADGAYGPEVIGINVGTYVRSTVLTQHGEVIERTSPHVIANTAASASPIARALADFDGDEPIADRGTLTEAEVLLAAAGIPALAGSGANRPTLHAAITEYQARNGLAPTGIATRGLLQRLRDEAQTPLAATISRNQRAETGSTR